jgi:hypothetical protein
MRTSTQWSYWKENRLEMGSECHKQVEETSIEEKAKAEACEAKSFAILFQSMPY